MSKEWKIASRPETLKPVKIKPGTKPPIDLPKDESDEAVNDWCEELRDHHETEGELLTVNGMLAYAEGSGLSEGDLPVLKKQITKIYGKPVKKEKEKMATTTKTPAEKKTSKPPKKEKDTAPKSDKKPPKKAAKAEAKTKPDKKPVKSESKVIFNKTVRGIPIRISETAPGKYRGTMFANGDTSGYPLRSVLRWMGFSGWKPSEARTALASLLKGWENGEFYAAALVEEGHVSSGKNGHDGVFGKYAELKKEEAKLVKALK